MSKACEVVVSAHDHKVHQADVAWLDLETADLGLRIGRVVVWGVRQEGTVDFDVDDFDVGSDGLSPAVWPSTSTPGLFAVRHPMQRRALAVFRRRFPEIDPADPEAVVLDGVDECTEECVDWCPHHLSGYITLGGNGHVL